MTTTATPRSTRAAQEKPKGLPETVFHEGRLSTAQPALENSLVDANHTKGGVGLGSHTLQVNSPAGAAPVPMRVVLRKALKPAFVILRIRIGLLKLKAKCLVLSLQGADPLSQQGQVLAQHRCTCMLVEQRLQLVQQRLKHFVFSRGLLHCEHPTQGDAA